MLRQNFNLSVPAVLVGLVSLISDTSGQTVPEKPLASSEESLIYETIGMMFAQGSGLGKMKFTEEQINHIMSGMKKGFAQKGMPLENAEIKQKVQAIMMRKMQLVRQNEQKELSMVAAENKAKGRKFLELLDKKENIIKNPSGFYYEIIRKGEGPNPTMDDSVLLHYHGTLIDGVVFDSSVDRGKPASFSMKGVIKGFSGGLTKTEVGGKIRIYIPSELGYGDNPRPGGKIKPGDTLIFDCELLAIN